MSWPEAAIAIAGIAAFAVVVVKALPFVRTSSADEARTKALADVNKRLEAMEAHLMSSSRLPAGLSRRA